MKVYIISSRSPLWIRDNRLFITLYFPYNDLFFQTYNNDVQNKYIYHLVSEENIKRQRFKYSTTLVKVDDKEINKLIIRYHKTR